MVTARLVLTHLRAAVSSANVPWAQATATNLLATVAICLIFIWQMMFPQSGAAAEAAVWTRVADLPTAQTERPAAVQSGGRIYVIGGIDSNRDYPPTHVYDPRTNRWTSAAPLLVERKHAAGAAALDGRIYVIGGASGPTLIVTTEVYDPNTNIWATLAPLPTPRQVLGAARGSDGRIYAVGGYSNAPLATAEAYDISTNTWSVVRPMSTAREAPAVVAGPDGRIYAFGGHSPGAQSTRSGEVYDPRTDQWSPVAPMSRGRAYTAGALGLDGRIYVTGGYEGSQLHDSAEAYDPRTNTWETLPPMLGTRFAHTSATGLDGRIYAIGGSETPATSPQRVEAYGVSKSLLTVTLDAPAALTISDGRYSPNPFTITGTAGNEGSSAARDVQATLSPPAGLSIDNGSLQQLVGDLAPGQQKQVTWSIRATGRSQTGNLSYFVTAASSNTAAAYASRQITVPGGVVSIKSITPNVGGDTGQVTATIHGGGFQPGATVKLTRSGQPDIVGSNVSVAGGGASLTAAFDLLGQARGMWNAVVANPGAADSTLAGAFSIDIGQAPEIWLDLIGPEAVRGGRETSFYVMYRNQGTIDLPRASIHVTFPQSVTWGQMSTLSPRVSTTAGGLTLLTFDAANVPPGSSHVIPLRLTSPGADYEVAAWAD